MKPFARSSQKSETVFNKHAKDNYPAHNIRCIRHSIRIALADAKIREAESGLPDYHLSCQW